MGSNRRTLWARHGTRMGRYGPLEGRHEANGDGMGLGTHNF